MKSLVLFCQMIGDNCFRKHHTLYQRTEQSNAKKKLIKLNFKKNDFFNAWINNNR